MTHLQVETERLFLVGDIVDVDGRRLLITHGHAADHALRKHRHPGMLGAVLHSRLVVLNRMVSKVRRIPGMEYRSLADGVKRRTGSVNDAVERFKEELCPSPGTGDATPSSPGLA